MIDRTGWLPSEGPPGEVNLLVVLDFPSSLSFQKRQHLFGVERGILGETLRTLGVSGGVSSVEITYAVPFLPQSSKPSAEDRALGRAALIDVVNRVKPKKILALGAIADAVIHDRERPGRLVDIRGRLQLVQLGYQTCLTVTSFPVYYLTKDADKFRDLAHDCRRLLENSTPESLPRWLRIDVEVPGVLKKFLQQFNTASAIAVDLETTGLDFLTDKILAIGIGAMTESGQSFQITIPYQAVYVESIRQTLKEFFETTQTMLVFHNAKFDLKFLIRYFGWENILDLPVRDTLIMNYILDERPFTNEAKPHGLKTLSRVRYDAEDFKFDFKAFWAIPEGSRDWDQFYEYLAHDIHYTIRLYFDLLSTLEKTDGFIELLDTILMPATLSLAEIENYGVRVDVDYLKTVEIDYRRIIEDSIQQMMKTVRRLLGPEVLEELNPNSPKQIQELLFDQLKLDDRSGSRSTSKEALQLLKHSTKNEFYRDLIDAILQYREQSKALSTYIQGLQKQVGIDGRIHAQFNIPGTATGRLSSSDPNLQNQPVLMGPIIRRAFIPRDGASFAEVDYSQLELRVAGHLSQDPVILQAYQAGRDIHKEVAAAAFSVPYDDVTYDQRYAAKYIDFGIIYGRSAGSLATGQELIEYGWSIAQAQVFIDNFLGQFKALSKWIQNQHRSVLADQEVRTLTGRVRRWPLILPGMTSHIERQAVNTPIQGTASDITLTSLIRVHRALKPYRSKIVLTVHDSIGVEIDWDEVDVVPTLIREIMTHPTLNLSISMKVDIEMGSSWGDIDEWRPDEKYWYHHPESDSWVYSVSDPTEAANATLDDGLLVGPYRFRQKDSSTL